MPIRNATAELIEYLNTLVSLDQQAMHDLVRARVRCGKALALHPTVQVALHEDTCSVGLLGILNGYAGAYDDGPRQGWGPISAIFEDGKLARFALVDNE